jgi:hypothetical protein
MNNTPTRALVIALGILLLVAGGAFAGLRLDDRTNPGGTVNTESSSTEMPEASESPDPSEAQDEAGDDGGNDANESPDEDSGAETEAGDDTGDDANEAPEAAESPDAGESPEADD